jgi:hypothetical protein
MTENITRKFANGTKATGSEAFVKVAEMINGAYHNGFSSLHQDPQPLKDLLQQCTAEALVEGRVDDSINKFSGNKIMNIAEYTKYTGDALIDKAEANVSNAKGGGVVRKNRAYSNRT